MAPLDAIGNPTSVTLSLWGCLIVFNHSLYCTYYVFRFILEAIKHLVIGYLVTWLTRTRRTRTRRRRRRRRRIGYCCSFSFKRSELTSITRIEYVESIIAIVFLFYSVVRT